jgi:N-acyl-D-aspartate/D-glutamate deacylase
MPHDLLVKNATIVDGTGAPRYCADLAIANGRIAEVGHVTDSAHRTLDASDLIVAPGFIDPHTHYDAQICWDPLISPSSWHGITTVIMGNCGVGIAPCKPAVREIATWDLVNVEAIPFDVLSRGITWDWVTFPEYMDAADRRRPGINLAFLAPLTPFRHFVMGEASMDRAATSHETAQIHALLKGAVDAGAFGFTTTNILQHIGFQGRPLACRLASRDELKSYANILRDAARGAIEIALTRSPGMMADDEYELLDFLLTESARPVTWLSPRKRVDLPDSYKETLRKAGPLIRRGALPQVSNLPLVNQLDLRNPFMMGSFPSWAAAFNRSVADQKRLYLDPAFRAAFRDDLRNPRVFHGKWDLLIVKEVSNPAMKPLEGRTVTDIARDRRRDGLDTFLDLAVEDDLELQYTLILFEVAPELLGDARTLIGVSDGGAHVDMLCDAGYPTNLLGEWVRDKGLLSLEHAVKRMTSEPADFFGIKRRGRIAAGNAADIVIFDAATINSGHRPEMITDLPGGGRRLVVRSFGIQYTIVNGEILYEGATHTDALPGRVLRSYEG